MSTTAWVRFDHAGHVGFGRLNDRTIEVHEGDLFAHPRDTGERLPLDAVRLCVPWQPGKILALWNNFGELAARQGLHTPEEPLYFVKTPNTVNDPGAPIRRPAQAGKVVFEGELGIVIGRRASAVSVDEALSHVFGYTCANDVTLVDILGRDAAFAQWTRAKGFDSFCPLGPVIATGLDARTLRVRTRLDGQLRQDFPLSDMRFGVAELVSRISHDMTLEPGDLILSGTSVGVGSMKPGSVVEVEIDGIGCLRNPYA